MPTDIAQRSAFKDLKTVTAADTLTKPRQIVTKRTGQLRLLVCEKSNAQRRIFASMVKGAGYEATFVGSGEEAMAVA
jgi:hypothetical protein